MPFRAPPTTTSTCTCPRCDVQLRVEPASSAAAERCPKCGGVWLPASEFNELVVDLDRQYAVLENEGGGSPSVDVDRYISCPTCGEVLNRQILWRRSGVLVDTCRKHGVWFDRGELRRAVKFLAERAADPDPDLSAEPKKTARKDSDDTFVPLIDDPRDHGWLVTILRFFDHARTRPTF